MLLDIDGFHLINREFGQSEGDRVLQAVGHMLLLNLRNDDLLCRYAGDRFALLLPDTSVEEAASLAEHLAAMVGQMRHHAKGGRVGISLRHACSNADAAPDVLLAELNRAVSQPAMASPAVSTTVVATGAGSATGRAAGPSPLAATAPA